MSEVKARESKVYIFFTCSMKRSKNIYDNCTKDAVLALLNNGADLNTMGKNGAGASGDITVTSDKDFRTILKQFPNQLYVKARLSTIFMFAPYLLKF